MESKLNRQQTLDGMMQPGTRKLTSNTKSLKKYIKENHLSTDNSFNQPNDLANLGNEHLNIQKSLYHISEQTSKPDVLMLYEQDIVQEAYKHRRERYEKERVALWAGRTIPSQVVNKGVKAK